MTPPPVPSSSRPASPLAGTGLRILLLLVACGAVYWRVLQPDVIPFAHDTLTHDLPIHLWAWDQVRESGDLPLWIPHLQNGLPTLGSFAWCPLYPTDWLMGLNILAGLRLQWWAALVIAGLGMAAWGYALGLPVAARWLGAVAFALSGHLVTLLSPGHLQKLQAIAWLPWALAAVEWGFRTHPNDNSIHPDGRGKTDSTSPGGEWRRGVLAGGGAGAAIGFQFLASHFQIAYLTLSLVVWRVLWLAGGTVLSRSGRRGDADSGRDNPLSNRWLAVAGSLPAFLAALALSAGLLGGAQLLSGLETARLSNRAEGVSYAEATLTSYPPGELLEYLFPRFLGDSVRNGWNSYWGDWGERLVTDYAGAGTILLVLIALVCGPRFRATRVWLLLTLTSTLLLALGDYTPVYRIAYEWLPEFNRFRSPGTQMVLVAWSLAALAALGLTGLLDTLRSGADSTRRWLLGLATVALLFPWVAIALLHLAAQARRQSLLLSGGDLPQLLLHRAILFSSVGGTCLWTGIFAGALVAALLIHRRSRLDPLRPVSGPAGTSCWHPSRWILAFPVAVLACDLIVRLQPFVSPEPAEPYLRYLYQSPIDQVIRQDPRLPNRLLDRGNELSLRPILSGVDVPLGYHPVSYRWRLETLEAVGLDNPALLRLWAIDYVRNSGADPPGPAPSWTPLLRSPDWTLWRDSTPSGFARFPDSLAVGQLPGDLLLLLDRFGLDSRRPALVSPDDSRVIGSWSETGRETTAWIAALPKPQSSDSFTTAVAQAWKRARAAESQAAPPGPRDESDSARAIVLEQSPDRWVLRVTAPRPAWLVLSTVPAPGWTAHVGADGGPALPVRRADGGSALIPWPGGEGILVLLYRPWSIRLGLFLTLFAGGLVFLALAARWTHQRTTAARNRMPTPE
jgi:hypothetical protein